MLTSAKIKALWPALMFFALILFLFFSLGSAKLPLSLSFALAYFFFPLIERLERARVPRQYSVIGSFVVTCTALALIFFLILPQLFDDARELMARLPALLEHRDQNRGSKAHWKNQTLTPHGNRGLTNLP
jgi:predicted PurR-regulated permease PerM